MFKRFFLLLLIAAAPPTFAERFAGSGSLTPNKVTSADQRFALAADLKPVAQPLKSATNGRFSLDANLRSAKALLAGCGPTSAQIFRNGFE
jgi:hypothetical protein